MKAVYIGLSDEQIIEMKQKIQMAKAGVKNISFKFSAIKKAISVEVFAIKDIISNNHEYFENIEEHLVFANFTWLSPLTNELIKKLNVNYQAQLFVNPDGSMDHKNVEISVSAAIPSDLKERKQILRYAENLFSHMIAFRSYIEHIEFKGNRNNLVQIIFSLKLDGSKVNAILNNNQVNRQVLHQWLAQLDNVMEMNKGNYKFTNKIPVINGRMSTASFESSLCFLFSLEKEEKFQ